MSRRPAPFSRRKCARERFTHPLSSAAKAVVVAVKIGASSLSSSSSSFYIKRSCLPKRRSVTLDRRRSRVLPATITWAPPPLVNIPRRRSREADTRDSARFDRGGNCTRTMNEVQSDGWRGRNKRGSCAGEVSPSTGALPRIRPL